MVAGIRLLVVITAMYRPCTVPGFELGLVRVEHVESFFHDRARTNVVLLIAFSVE